MSYYGCPIFHHLKNTCLRVSGPLPSAVLQCTGTGQSLGPVLKPASPSIPSVHLSPYIEHLPKAVRVDTGVHLPGLESWMVYSTNCANLVKSLKFFVPQFPHL